MPFHDRQEAAQLLAQRLARYQGKNPLILAIPRGAVPMGAILAERLAGELDVVLVHKLGAPGNPEYAIGSVDESGHVQLTDRSTVMNIPQSYIDNEVAAQLESLRRRRARYTPIRPPVDPRGRIVIIVDDGIATGSTLMAAARAVREKAPERLIAAVGVAPCDTVKRIAAEVDEVECLECSNTFFAVGQFFEDFTQVSDEEVIELLAARQTQTAGA